MGLYAMQHAANTRKRGPKPNPQTRKNLIEAGVRMIHEAGYTATGIQDIVNAADVPKGSFYNHFESKEAFAAAVVDTYFEQSLEFLRSFFDRDDIPALKRLELYFSTRIQTFRSAGYTHGCMLGNLSLELADQSHIIRERLATHFNTWSALFEGCIAEAQRSGALQNPLSAAVLARFLLNSWEGALLRMRAEKSDRALSEFMEVVFSQVLV